MCHEATDKSTGSGLNIIIFLKMLILFRFIGYGVVSHGPDHQAFFLPSSRGWGWCIWQSWAGCCAAWSWVWPETPCTAVPPCGTSPSWSLSSAWSCPSSWLSCRDRPLCPLQRSRRVYSMQDGRKCSGANAFGSCCNLYFPVNNNNVWNLNVMAQYKLVRPCMSHLNSSYLCPQVRFVWGQWLHALLSTTVFFVILDPTVRAF